MRLTVLYGSVFLVSGAALLGLTYFLVGQATAGASVTSVTGTAITPSGAHALTATSHAIDLHELLVQSGIALAVMTVLSGLLGWLIAGRVLAPVSTMTAATRRISAANLHDRLALGGPDDELRELADTIDGLLARLEAAFAAQRRFVANASHELRTPLAMMRTTLDVAIAKPGGVPEPTRALDANLRLDLDRAERLLESFLTLAQAQHEALSDPARVPLAGLLTDALEARHDRIADQHIEVHAVLSQVCVEGSRTLLARMIENVIENAVLHNEPHGFISIGCEPQGVRACLVIESSGALLGADDVGQLAQPFRRMGAARTGSKQGFGLGLSIVSAVAAAHGGELELHARAGGGLRVQINLPRAALATPAAVAM